MYTGIWTPWNEEWFQTRMRDIFNGTARPMNVREWKSALRQFNGCAKLADAMDKCSAAVFEDRYA